MELKSVCVFVSVHVCVSETVYVSERECTQYVSNKNKNLFKNYTST